MCQTNKTNKKIIIRISFIFISISWSTISSNTSLQVIVCLNMCSLFEMTLFIFLYCRYFIWTYYDRLRNFATIYLIAWQFLIPEINKQYEMSDTDWTRRGVKNKSEKTSMKTFEITNNCKKSIIFSKYIYTCIFIL
jgi:hypothetical protein